MLVARRLEGEPLQYVLGTWAFCGVDLQLDRSVLIPRPETEYLVELALGYLDEMQLSTKASNSNLEGAGLGGNVANSNLEGAGLGGNVANDQLYIGDLGTGSGAIAIAIANSLRLRGKQEFGIVASDISKLALETARENARVNRVEDTIRFYESDWFEGFDSWLCRRFKLIISNPPYVSEGELTELDKTISQWEPYQALVAGKHGTEAIEKIVLEARNWLADDGVLICEIGETHGAYVRDIACRCGYERVEIIADQYGRERYLLAVHGLL